MAVSNSFLPTRPRPERSYLRRPSPIHFPTAAVMPEGNLHFELCITLYLLVRDFVGERGTVGCDQFMYWDASDPRQCLAPDLLVRLGGKPGPFPCWKTWEAGAPHLAVEIISDSDRGEAAWQKKFESYRRAGVDELVRFDAKDEHQPLRLWDRLEGDLSERDLSGEHARHCDTLGVYWFVQKNPTLGHVLRLSHDPRGEELIPLAAERARTAIEQKEAALARIAELEAELRRR